jgi:hypothetical protein
MVVGILHADTWHLLSAKVALASLTSGYRSAAVVRSRTQATEYFFFRTPNIFFIYGYGGFKIVKIIYVVQYLAYIILTSYTAAIHNDLLSDNVLNFTTD